MIMRAPANTTARTAMGTITVGATIAVIMSATATTAETSATNRRPANWRALLIARNRDDCPEPLLAMPIVLMQRVWQDDPRYKDAEYIVYHYPEQYFDRIRGGEQFVYYRPSRGARVSEASCYFGCGVLGDIWPDPDGSPHRFVGIEKGIPFSKPVPYTDNGGNMYESRYSNRSAFQGQSIRHIDDFDFYRILNAAGLTSSLFSEAPSVGDVLAGRVSPLMTTPPRDKFRPLDIVPDGTGYRPTGNVPDVQESAALQERARADHQDTLRLLKAEIDRRGGTCLFNNNVDLLASFGEQRFLVEVKSLARPLSAVDRMRYGMGQLFDYSVRYRADIGRAKPVLAFGANPGPDVAWVAEILQGNNVAFVARDNKRLHPANELAKDLPIFR